MFLNQGIINCQRVELEHIPEQPFTLVDSFLSQVQPGNTLIAFDHILKAFHAPGVQEVVLIKM
jgi:hypothetical protein